MPINIENNSLLSDLIDDMRDRPREVLRRRLPVLANEVVNRAQSGVDNRGTGYAPYSEGYEALKRRIGRSGRPDLTLTGDMLNSIQHQITSRAGLLEGTISVTGSFNQQKARWNQGENNNIPNRPFMFLPPEDIESLIRDMYQFIS